jgi:hypothetical protein
MGNGGQDEESSSCDCAVADMGETDSDDGMDDESEYSSIAPVRSEQKSELKREQKRTKSEKRRRGEPSSLLGLELSSRGMMRAERRKALVACIPRCLR